MVKAFENSGYWAVILGGSSGLGLASAKKLAQEGMNIIIIHRNGRAEMEVIEGEFDVIRNTGVEFVAYNTDALNPQKQAELIDNIKSTIKNNKIRCVLHSVAKGSLKPMAGENALTTEDLQITMHAMAFSFYEWAKALYSAGVFAHDARLLAFTSEGSVKAWQSYGAVSAAKAALEAIARNMALEFAPYGLRTNCIMAGITDTQSMRMIPGSDALAEQTKTRNPFKRLTIPEDVADTVYLLCLDEAAWINGAVIPVNGGEHLQ
ncbi:MAG: SDR family oxidoreductase [Flavobacterium sp.]